MAINRLFMTLLAVSTLSWAQNRSELTKERAPNRGSAEKSVAEPSVPLELIPPLSPIFNDDFETGATLTWDETVPPPDIPNCNCYFSSDCNAGFFCYWGPGGPFVEDHCNWRIPKPGGVPGANCDQDVDNAGPICDGHCTPSRAGSIFGLEDPTLVILGIRLWSAAILEPAAQGGGPVDPSLSAEALSLPFSGPSAAIILGRHVADMLAYTIDIVFYDHFCHFENHPGEAGPVVDLSSDDCRLQASLLVVDALTAEIEAKGSGEGSIWQIPMHCPAWGDMFAPRCPTGPEGLDCLYRRIQGAAELLTLPPQF